MEALKDVKSGECSTGTNSLLNGYQLECGEGESALLWQLSSGHTWRKKIWPRQKCPRILNRWSTVEEILSYLISFDSHDNWITMQVPNKSPSGTVLFFDRTKTKSYRNDGYDWKTRKMNIKSVREDRMKLKVCGMQLLYGCYTHCASIPTLHRRSYWLIQNPDLIMVHYLAVDNDTSFPDVSSLSTRTLTSDATMMLQDQAEVRHCFTPASWAHLTVSDKNLCSIFSRANSALEIQTLAAQLRLALDQNLRRATSLDQAIAMNNSGLPFDWVKEIQPKRQRTKVAPKDSVDERGVSLANMRTVGGVVGAVPERTDDGKILKVLSSSPHIIVCYPSNGSVSYVLVNSNLAGGRGGAGGGRGVGGEGGGEGGREGGGEGGGSDKRAELSIVSPSAERGFDALNIPQKNPPRSAPISEQKPKGSHGPKGKARLDTGDFTHSDYDPLRFSTFASHLVRADPLQGFSSLEGAGGISAQSPQNPSKFHVVSPQESLVGRSGHQMERNHSFEHLVNKATQDPSLYLRPVATTNASSHSDSELETSGRPDRMDTFPTLLKSLPLYPTPTSAAAGNGEPAYVHSSAGTRDVEISNRDPLRLFSTRQEGAPADVVGVGISGARYSAFSFPTSTPNLPQTAVADSASVGSTLFDPSSYPPQPTSQAPGHPVPETTALDAATKTFGDYLPSTHEVGDDNASTLSSVRQHSSAPVVQSRENSADERFATPTDSEMFDLSLNLDQDSLNDLFKLPLSPKRPAEDVREAEAGRARDSITLSPLSQLMQSLIPAEMEGEESAALHTTVQCQCPSEGDASSDSDSATYVSEPCQGEVMATDHSASLPTPGCLQSVQGHSTSSDALTAEHGQFLSTNSAENMFSVCSPLSASYHSPRASPLAHIPHEWENLLEQSFQTATPTSVQPHSHSNGTSPHSNPALPPHPQSPPSAAGMAHFFPDDSLESLLGLTSDSHPHLDHQLPSPTLTPRSTQPPSSALSSDALEQAAIFIPTTQEDRNDGSESWLLDGASLPSSQDQGFLLRPPHPLDTNSLSSLSDTASASSLLELGGMASQPLSRSISPRVLSDIQEEIPMNLGDILLDPANQHMQGVMEPANFPLQSYRTRSPTPSSPSISSVSGHSTVSSLFDPGVESPSVLELCELLSESPNVQQHDFSNMTFTDIEQKQLYKAIQIIQNAFRKFKTQWQQLPRVEDRRKHAALLIENYYSRYRQLKLQQDRAARRIQQSYRLYRNRSQELNRAALFIQQMYRFHRIKRQQPTSLTSSLHHYMSSTQPH